MNRRFSNLAICILGAGFIASPVNQKGAFASQSIVERGTQGVNQIVNRYNLDQEKPQEELQNSTLISQNYNNSANGIVEGFRYQSNEIVNQYREGVKKRQQQRLQNSTMNNMYEDQRYNPNQISPSSQDSRSNITPSNIRMLQQQNDVIRMNPIVLP